MRFFKKATRKVEESLEPDVEKIEFFAVLNKIRDNVTHRRMKPPAIISNTFSSVLLDLTRLFEIR
jgi:hypothetical protein